MILFSVVFVIIIIIIVVVPITSIEWIVSNEFFVFSFVKLGDGKSETGNF
jgi:uncharacterized membrane protein YdbT with pleckstrin-like domain